MTQTTELPKSKKLKGGEVVSKIAINSKSLLSACNIASKAIDPKSIVPAISNILINVEAGGMKLTGTNLKQTIVTKMDYPDLFCQAYFLFPAALGMRLLQSLPDSPIEISHITKSHTAGTVASKVHAIEIQCQGNHYTLESENPTDFVKVNNLEDIQPISLPSEDVFKGLLYCKANASKDALRPALTGLSFKAKGSDFSVVATDGFTIAKYVALLSEPVDQDLNFILPSAASNLLEDLRGEDITVRLSANGVEFSDDKTSIFTLIIEDKYPDIDGVLPTEYATEMVFDATSMKAALNRAIILGSSAAATYFNLSEQGIQINTVDDNINNDATELIPVEDFTGNPFLIGFDPNYLSRLLSKIGSGNVQVKGNASMRPLILYPDIEPGLLFLLMPSRLPAGVE